jgi:hypothetical protein
MHSYEVSHYPYLADIAVKAGLNKTMTELESIKLLMPYCSEMYRWGLERIYRQFASDSGIYQWIYLGYSERKNNVEFDELSPLVNEIGYSTYNLAGIFGVYNKNDVSLSSSDNHPSALGHQIIADSLFQQLADDQQLAFRLRQRYQRKFGNQ